MYALSRYVNRSQYMNESFYYRPLLFRQFSWLPSETASPGISSYLPDRRIFARHSAAFQPAPPLSFPEFSMRKSLPLKKMLFSVALAGGAVAGLLGYPPGVQARVKLITLPVRERVEIQLDNASATLVEE